MKSRLSLAALVSCLTALAATALPGQKISAVPPSQQEPHNAIVRILSHGASATVIQTQTNRSLLLGCGHAYQGASRSKPMVLDVPTHQLSDTHQKVGITLLDVDYQADLSLVQLNAGPLEACAPVAPAGFVPGPHIVSIGYDQMRLPAVQMYVSIVKQSQATTYTAQRPGSGRSGGALVDADTGYLIGVVQGYEVAAPKRGMYVSHQTILNFLKRPRQGNGNPSPHAPPETPYPLPYSPCPPSS